LAQGDVVEAGSFAQQNGSPSGPSETALLSNHCQKESDGRSPADRISFSAERKAEQQKGDWHRHGVV